MARAGEVIEHPVSGETMVFLQTSAETGGDLLQIDLFVRPGGAVSVAHIHPEQEERIIVKRGEMTLRIGDEARLLGPGDEAVVPAGTPHAWANTGDAELNAILELRPAGRFEAMISTFFGIAKAGHVNASGMPGMLQTAVTLSEYRDTIRLAGLAPPVEQLVIPGLAALGRFVGLRPDYPYPYSARVNGGMEIWRSEPPLARELSATG